MTDEEKLATLREMLSREVRWREAAEAEVERLRAENQRTERGWQAADECVWAMRDEANEGGKLIARLRDQNARMREIVEAVASLPLDSCVCLIDDPETTVHLPGCWIWKARELLNGTK